jgi:predicted Zn-dependent peptidase
VLFVEARELPMFDLRLTFAAGSSQDGGTPGLATLTNAMLNEGVAGKDVTAIAEGFEGLGADFGNGSYRDMAVASLRSLSAADKREPALKLFTEVVGKPTFPEDALKRIKNQMLAGFEYQKQNPGKIAGKALFGNLYGDHPYAHPATARPRASGHHPRPAARLPRQGLCRRQRGDRAGRRPQPRRSRGHRRPGIGRPAQRPGPGRPPSPPNPRPA